MSDDMPWLRKPQQPDIKELVVELERELKQTSQSPWAMPSGPPQPVRQAPPLSYPGSPQQQSPSTQPSLVRPGSPVPPQRPGPVAPTGWGGSQPMPQPQPIQRVYPPPGQGQQGMLNQPQQQRPVMPQTTAMPPMPVRPRVAPSAKQKRLLYILLGVLVVVAIAAAWSIFYYVTHYV